MSADVPATVVARILALVSTMAARPEAVARLATVPERKITLVLFERSAGLRTIEVPGVPGVHRLPDRALIAGQRMFIYSVAIGGGRFAAEPVAADRIPETVPIVFASIPVLCALLIGRSGAAHYDGLVALRNGDADSTGDIGELVGLFGVFQDLVAQARVELFASTAPPPAPDPPGAGHRAMTIPPSTTETR